MPLPLDPAQRDAAAHAVRQARVRYGTLIAVIGRRTDFDLNARRMRMCLGVVEPVITALENLLAEDDPTKPTG